MDPEQEINTYLRSKGVQRAVLNDMLNGFAHDLANAIRATIYHGGGEDACDCLECKATAKAADLIDPEVKK